MSIEWEIKAVDHFLEQEYQIFGTSFWESIIKRDTYMGAPWAPAYASLYLGLWEEEEVVYKSLMYLGHRLPFPRYIDDVLME